MSITSCLNLMRRMPPSDIRTNLSGIVILAPDHVDELLQRVDQPLEEATDPNNGRQYLLCEYNRDADSYRSPWSNQYFPPLEEPYMLPDDLRGIEEEANILLDAYRELYFQSGVSSVYLWEIDEEESSGGFAGAFLIKKNSDQGSAWESIHVVQVSPLKGDAKKAIYKLNTTIMISIIDRTSGSTSISGNISNAVEQTDSYSTMNSHLVNIGRMIEKMENDVRSNIDGVYIQKTRQVLVGIRKTDVMQPTQGTAFTTQLNQAIGIHGAKRDDVAKKLNAMLKK